MPLSEARSATEVSLSQLASLLDSLADTLGEREARELCWLHPLANAREELRYWAGKTRRVLKACARGWEEVVGERGERERDELAGVERKESDRLFAVSLFLRAG